MRTPHESTRRGGSIGCGGRAAMAPNLVEHPLRPLADVTPAFRHALDLPHDLRRVTGHEVRAHAARILGPLVRPCVAVGSGE